MNRLRGFFLFLADGVILLVLALFLSHFSLRYSLMDAVGRGELPIHLLLLYGCTVVFQLIFHTYDSLWRYAESREYLSCCSRPCSVFSSTRSSAAGCSPPSFSSCC